MNHAKHLNEIALTSTIGADNYIQITEFKINKFPY